MPKRPVQTEIYLWGPPVIDWLYISHGGDEAVPAALNAPGQPKIYLSPQPGGIFLLYRLLREMLPNSKESLGRSLLALGEPPPELPLDNNNREMAKYLADLTPLDETRRHTWSLWAYEGEPRAYRMSTNGVTTCEPGKIGLASPFPPGNERPGQSLLVLDDPGREAFDPLPLQNAIDPWLTNENATFYNLKVILLRLASRTTLEPLEIHKSPLYTRLLAEQPLRERTTIVTTVRTLRTQNVHIGESLSWERMLDDVVCAVDTCFNRQFNRVIVTIGLCGAVIIEYAGDTVKSCVLIYDHSSQEGDFEAKHCGKVLGLSTCMLAALSTAWTHDPACCNWTQAAHAGLAMMRTLSLKGYCPSHYPSNRQILVFPLGLLRDCYYRESRQYHPGPPKHASVHRSKCAPRRPLGTFAHTSLTSPSEAELWTILEKVTTGYSTTASQDDELIRLAMEIVRLGPEATQGRFPVESVGKWYSADRAEIEGVRSVRNAMRVYKDGYLVKKETKPLSIGVFGPPGAGKSFVVGEIARVLNIETRSQLVFNLSQYESARDLARAFHRARDVVLQGDIPLVFWDEFDSPLAGQALGWLRCFLSPMQEGMFLDDGLIHPVGGGIYIFAGGTTSAFKDFAGLTSEEESVAKEPDEEERVAKKPDFVSRLRAYIDVKGPNKTNKGTASDNSYIIRRAFLLRSQIEKHSNLPKKLGREYEIDPGVLSAFLKTETYRHGARSMENIVRLSNFAGKTKYELSSLPPEHLLQMHVDVADFMRHVKEGERDARARVDTGVTASRDSSDAGTNSKP